ncbi:gamma-glutamyltranspeptidase/glutathione hydrolase [Desulfitispora alkaliphila]
MNFNYMYYPNPSKRMSTFARDGMVATSQPQAAQIGLDILKKGGNAIDAAVAMAASLTVLEPTSNGIGGDAFALVWHKGSLYGLNASGPAPAGISIEELTDRGISEMPRLGWTSVTVPGAPAAWSELWKRFGRLEFQRLFEGAIDYATSGYPVSPVVAHFWDLAYQDMVENADGYEFESWFRTFSPKGRAPRAGEIWKSSDVADTLRAIGETEARAFYRGALAQKIHEASSKCGGFLTASDLAEYKPQWVDPVKVNYKGYDVWELPPNGQGIVALMALNMLKKWDFSESNVEMYHHQIEAMKLAFADGLNYITDREHMEVTVEALLADEYADQRRKEIGNRAVDPKYGKPPMGGTVYLATADREGNMVSFIQSNYRGFGSGIVVPGTGISLQNRGHTFSLDPAHPNCLKPGKKTYHTIIPGFLSKGNEPVGPFGVMGAFMQPQGHVQVLMNTLDLCLNPQATLDAPRWRWVEGNLVEVESNFPEDMVRALEERGHKIKRSKDIADFGRGQIIWRLKEGVLVGASDPRADGIVAAW